MFFFKLSLKINCDVLSHNCDFSSHNCVIQTRNSENISVSPPPPENWTLTRNCEFISHNSVKKSQNCEIKSGNYLFFLHIFDVFNKLFEYI